MANGLNAADEKKLTKMLRQLEHAATRSFLSGGREARAIDDLIASIKLRLTPTSVQSMEEKFNELAETHRGFYWYEEALKVA